LPKLKNQPMKKYYYLLAILIFSLNEGFSQNTSSEKPIVMKPVYFDVSPPLREMVKQQGNAIPRRIGEEKEINKQNRKVRTEWTAPKNFMDPLRQYFFGSLPTDTTIQNFDGVNASGYLPPDTDGDVGLDHYFQVTNCRFAIYDKTGVKLIGPSQNSSIFNGLPHNSNDGDAIVLYDQVADRWLFSQFSLPTYPNGPFWENVAISQTSDPTGSWYRYQFQFTDMPDYPKLSIWKDGYYMTIRRFTSGSGSWIGPACIAMDRVSMIAGNPTANMVMFTLPSSSEGPLAADCDSDFPPDGTPEYVAYLTQGNPGQVKIYEFHVDWANTANSTFNLAYSVPISAFTTFGQSNVVPQKGTNAKLDAFSRKGIMHRMPFRIIDNHWTIAAITTVNVSGVAGIRWMELRNYGAGWDLYQEGTYSPDNNWRFMGSIAMDSLGDMALGFSISSANMFPSIRYTGRMANDPLGEMTIAEAGIINGGGSQSDPSGRWGDYSAMSPDPSENGKFWYTQEYYSSTSSASWKTRIASFSFANILSVSASAVPNPVCTGGTTQLNGLATGGSGTYTYSWTSDPAGFTSTQQNPTAIPTVDTKYILSVNDGTQTRTDTLPVTVQQMPIAYAGPDTSYCYWVPLVPLPGQAVFASHLKWTTAGDGYFNIDTVQNTLYHPGQADVAAGGFTATLTTYAISPCTTTATDDIHITLDPCTGIDQPAANDFGVTVTPNPSHGVFTLSFAGTMNQDVLITVSDVRGEQVLSQTLKGSGNLSRTIDLSGSPKGVYMVKAKTDTHSRVEKIVIQ
jgi:hypothetical protein